MWGMLPGARRDMGFIGALGGNDLPVTPPEFSAAALAYGEKEYACGYPMH